MIDARLHPADVITHDEEDIGLGLLLRRWGLLRVCGLSNPRLDGKNLAYDVRTLKGTLPATAIDGTLFIDGSGGYCDPGYDRGDPGYPCWAQKAFADGTP